MMKLAAQKFIELKSDDGTKANTHHNVVWLNIVSNDTKQDWHKVRTRIAKCASGRTDVVRVKTGTEATDAAEGMMNQQCATMPTNRTERQPSPNTLPPMGFGRNQGRGAAQHFSEAELERLIEWYHEGAGCRKEGEEEKWEAGGCRPYQPEAA